MPSKTVNSIELQVAIYSLSQFKFPHLLCLNLSRYNSLACREVLNLVSGWFWPLGSPVTAPSCSVLWCFWWPCWCCREICSLEWMQAAHIRVLVVCFCHLEHCAQCHPRRWSTCRACTAGSLVCPGLTWCPSFSFARSCLAHCYWLCPLLVCLPKYELQCTY